MQPLFSFNFISTTIDFNQNQLVLNTLTHQLEIIDRSRNGKNYITDRNKIAQAINDFTSSESWQEFLMYTDGQYLENIKENIQIIHGSQRIYNKKIENSFFYSIVSKIIEYVTLYHFSLKCREIHSSLILQNIDSRMQELNKEYNEENDDFSKLPQELKELIFSLLNNADFMQVALVSKQWNEELYFHIKRKAQSFIRAFQQLDEKLGFLSEDQDLKREALYSEFEVLDHQPSLPIKELVNYLNKMKDTIADYLLDYDSEVLDRAIKELSAKEINSDLMPLVQDALSTSKGEVVPDEFNAIDVWRMEEMENLPEEFICLQCRMTIQDNRNLSERDVADLRFCSFKIPLKLFLKKREGERIYYTYKGQKVRLTIRNREASAKSFEEVIKQNIKSYIDARLEEYAKRLLTLNFNLPHDELTFLDEWLKEQEAFIKTLNEPVFDIIFF